MQTTKHKLEIKAIG